MTTLIEALKKATTWLSERGVETPRLDAEVLFARHLGCRRLDLYLRHDRPLSGAEREALRALVVERGRGVPVAYLTGEREFYSLAFRVTRDVLVPRPETEGLVTVVLAAIESVPEPRVADVGTGSGCAIVSVLHARPDARGFATDVSGEALAVARGNADRHGALPRLDLRDGHVLDPLRGDPVWGRLDAVLSNPPYVVRGDPTLDPKVAAFEPATALYVAGQDALACARAVAEAAASALRPGGFLAIEVGSQSGEAAARLLRDLGYAEVAVDRDAAGLPRVVHGVR